MTTVLPPCSANHPGHRTGARATCVSHKGARTTRRGAHDTCGNQVRVMPTCAVCRDGVIRPHAHSSVGRQVVDDQDNTRRGGALGPHAHRNLARHVVDDLSVGGEWVAKTEKRPPRHRLRYRGNNTSRNTGRSS